MMFQKKIDRAMEWLREKNKSLHENSQGKSKDGKNKDDIELDKKDIIAVILSALMVFGPIILILLLIAILIYI